MSSDWPEFPEITKEHLLNARLYANRDDMIGALPVRRRGLVAEIGVWRAAFSKVLVTKLHPRRFLAFDIFTGHLEEDWHGISGHELFDGLTHRQFYEREMKNYSDILSVIEGRSEITLPNYAQRIFDFVYVDAAHDYDSVKADTEIAVDMVADDGILVFNDYTLLDKDFRTPYGVVPVVNDLIVNRGWRVIGYALNLWMYCDIALRRSNAQRHSASR